MRSRHRPGSFGGFSALAIVVAALVAFVLLGEDPADMKPGVDTTLVEAGWICVGISAGLGLGLAIAAGFARVFRRLKVRSRSAALRRLSPGDSQGHTRFPMPVDPADIPGAGSRSPFAPPEAGGPPQRPRHVTGSPGARRRPGRSSRFWSKLLSPSKPAGGRLGQGSAEDSRWLS